MAIFRRKLKVSEVSLCEHPANQHSRVALFKAASEETGETKPDAESGKGESHMKTEGGKSYPASDYAYVPDPAMPSTWKLRLTSVPGGPPDPHIVGAAVAALGAGFRGQKVQLPASARAGVVSRVRAAWMKAHGGKGPVPPVLKESEMSETPTLSVDELMEQLESANAAKAALEKAMAEQESAKVALTKAEADHRALAEELAKRDERIAKIEDERLTERLTVRVAKLSIAIPSDKAPDTVKMLKGLTPEARDVVFESLEKAEALAVKAEGLFKEIGRVSHAENSAQAEVAKLVSEAVASGKTPEQARASLWKSNPDLRARFELEMRS